MMAFPKLLLSEFLRWSGVAAIQTSTLIYMNEYRILYTTHVAVGSSPASGAAASNRTLTVCSQWIVHVAQHHLPTLDWTLTVSPCCALPDATKPENIAAHGCHWWRRQQHCLARSTAWQYCRPLFGIRCFGSPLSMGWMRHASSTIFALASSYWRNDISMAKAAAWQP